MHIKNLIKIEFLDAKYPKICFLLSMSSLPVPTLAPVPALVTLSDIEKLSKLLKLTSCSDSLVNTLVVQVAIEYLKGCDLSPRIYSFLRRLLLNDDDGTSTHSLSREELFAIVQIAFDLEYYGCVFDNQTSKHYSCHVFVSRWGALKTINIVGDLSEKEKAVCMWAIVQGEFM